jgi:hypothetical protein
VNEHDFIAQITVAWDQDCVVDLLKDKKSSPIAVTKPVSFDGDNGTGSTIYISRSNILRTDKAMSGHPETTNREDEEIQCGRSQELKCSQSVLHP